MHLDKRTRQVKHPAMFKGLSALLLALGLVGSTPAQPPPRSPAWVDAIWVDHLLIRGSQFARHPVVEEAFYRDALTANPRSPAAVEALAKRYRMNDEPALAAAAVSYGRLLEPARPGWTDVWSWAWTRVEKGLTEPKGKEAGAHYKSGLEAMLAAVKSNQFIQAEQQVRALLREIPRDARLMENVATLGRMTRQPALSAMAYAYMLELYPSNFPVANNLAATLEGIGLPGPAFATINRFVPQNATDPYVLGNAARLADAARLYEEEDRLSTQWRTTRPDDAEAWMASTRTALRKGQAEAAKQFWRETHQRATPQQRTTWLGQSPFADHATLLEEVSP